MSHHIQIQEEFSLPEGLAATLLAEAAELVLTLEGVTTPQELSLILADDDHLQRLNRDFRGMDTPTDILSFPSDPLPPEILAELDSPIYLGDIIISVPYAARRAVGESHSLVDELRLLVIHGTLHLLGYDHNTPEKQGEMWAKQTAALQHLQIPWDVPAYLHDDETPN